MFYNFYIGPSEESFPLVAYSICANSRAKISKRIQITQNPVFIFLYTLQFSHTVSFGRSTRLFVGVIKLPH